MKVLFYYRGIENLGVGYLMSMLKRRGHEVKLIFDPGLDNNLYFKAPYLKWLNNHDKMVDDAREFGPGLIAIGSLTNLWSYAGEMAERLKEATGAPIIVGGHHAQTLPDYVLEHPAVDFVCTGEGENPLLELANKLQAGEDGTNVRGTWAKKDGQVIRNEMANLEQDLDRFPFPDKEAWVEHGCVGTHLEIFTGRGCPFKCTFCNIHYQAEIFKGYGDFIRKRSVECVIEELREYVGRYKPSYLMIHDDNFTAVPKWVKAFCEAYKAEFDIPWFCFGYPTTIKKDLMEKMKAAHCHTIFMGVDSGSEEVRRTLMERPMKDELIYNAASIIQDAGINLHLSAIYGVPGETAEQMWETLEMMERIKPAQCSSYIFYPFPKTKLHEKAVTMGYLDEAGQERVRTGASSYHIGSILNHPHKDLAECLAKATPLYVRSPRVMRPVIRWLIRNNARMTLRMLYLALFPFIFPSMGLEGVRLQSRMVGHAFNTWLRYKLGRLGRSRRGITTLQARLRHP